MKLRSLRTPYFLLLALLAAPSVQLAQGPLTPPGAPAPTMKTLDQSEPRAPISTSGTNITTGLSCDLTNGGQSATRLPMRRSSLALSFRTSPFPLHL